MRGRGPLLLALANCLYILETGTPPFYILLFLLLLLGPLQLFFFFYNGAAAAAAAATLELALAPRLAHGRRGMRV